MQSIEQAIFATVAYADIFQYPLTVSEIHRYLTGTKASVNEVQSALATSELLDERLSHVSEYYTLAGHEENLGLRRQRGAISAQLWPRAVRYGSWIGDLPYVRMVAVTGSLAVDNASESADLDYLIVTRPGRLWLTRAMVILMARMASRRGDLICPNYFLSERALVLSDRNLFTAHELAQMVPITGLPVYQRMRKLNNWVSDYLPNAGVSFWASTPPPPYLQFLRPAIENALSLTPFDWLERWEKERKVKKFGLRLSESFEACFNADQCKGHFGNHSLRVQTAFNERMRALEEVFA